MFCKPLQKCDEEQSHESFKNIFKAHSQPFPFLEKYVNKTIICCLKKQQLSYDRRTSYQTTQPLFVSKA